MECGGGLTSGRHHPSSVQFMFHLQVQTPVTLICGQAGDRRIGLSGFYPGHESRGGPGLLGYGETASSILLWNLTGACGGVRGGREGEAGQRVACQIQYAI